VAAFAAALIAGSSVRATRSREPHTGLSAAATPATAAAVRWKVTAQRISPAARDTTPVAITGVTVIDVARGRRVPGQTVVIRGTRVAGVGTRVTVPRGARLVDGRGKFLIPGLWDMHVHVLMAGPRLSLLPLYVANGVTRVRDMGGTIPLDEQRAVRRALEAGERVGPVVAAAPGPILTAPGGPRDRLTGGMRLGPTLNVSVATAADARRVVDSLHAAGADFIKLTFPPREAYIAAVDQAHARRIPLVGHVPASVTPREAVDAGQRSIEHMGRLPAFCGDSAVAALRAVQAADTVTQQTIRRLLGGCVAPDDSGAASLGAAAARRGTWVDPTLVQLRFHHAVLGDTAHVADALRHTPGWLRQYWTEDPFVLGTTPLSARAALLAWPGRLAFVGALHRAGVQLLAGTDSPSYPFSSPGFSLHDELALLVAAGLSPLEALRAATLNPARFLNATDSLGSVAPGKLADLVLLDADPLADIRNTTTIRAVMLNGRYLDRAALDDLLAHPERAVGTRSP